MSRVDLQGSCDHWVYSEVSLKFWVTILSAQKEDLAPFQVLTHNECGGVYIQARNSTQRRLNRSR